MNRNMQSLAVVAFASVGGLLRQAEAQVIDPFYADAYQLADLGSVAGVLANYAG